MTKAKTMYRTLSTPIAMPIGFLYSLGFFISAMLPSQPRRTDSYIGINEEVPPEEMKMVNAAVIPVRKVGRPMA